MATRHKTRRHRWTGILLLLPFLAWSLSGMVFLLQPGYEQAYEQLPLRLYGLAGPLMIDTQPEWREVRYIRSTLGEHLLVRTPDGWQHLRADTGETWPLPGAEEIERLLEDAFSYNPQRYGNVVEVDDGRAMTDTGVELALNWSTLGISQRGRDSRLIDRIYSIHYLQWTGIALLDRVLGLAGLALLIYLTWSGARMAFPRFAGQHSTALQRKRI